MKLLKPDVTPSDGAELEAALVADVRRQLQEEERRQRLNDPWPIPVQLRPADAAITDHWQVIRAGDGDGTPLPLTGNLSQIDTLFSAIPSGRMVLIGPAGCGKTVAARRLAVLRADAWQSGQPVPVLLSLAAWNVTRQPLPQWLVQQIADDHPAVPQARTVARTLLVAGRLLVILDGFDELLPQARRQALHEINQSLSAPQLLVITSRADEYTAEVTASDVLTAAAVLRLQPVPLATAFTFLQEAGPPTTAARWRDVQARVTERDPLALVLRTPLFVTMARALYDTAAANPAELLDRARLPDRAALERTLLGQYVDQAARSIAADSGGVISPRRVATVHRHLRTLAAIVRTGRTGDLSWWQTPHVVPAVAAAAPISMTLGLLGAVSFAVVLGGKWQVACTSLFATLAGVFVAVTVGAITLPPRPTAGGRYVEKPHWMRAIPVPALVAGAGAVSLLAAAVGGVAAVYGARTLVVDLTGLLFVVFATVWLLSPSWADLRYTDWDRRRERWLGTALAFTCGGAVFVAGAVEGQVSPGRVYQFAVLAGFAVAAAVSGIIAGRRPRVRSRHRRHRASRRRVMLSWLVAVTVAALLTAVDPFLWWGAVQAAVVALALRLLGETLVSIGPGYRTPRRVAPRLGDAAPVIVPRVGLGAIAGAIAVTVMTLLFPALSWPVWWAAGISTGDLPVPALPALADMAPFVFVGALTGLLVGVLHWVLAPIDHGRMAGPRQALHTDATVLGLLLAVPAAVAGTLAAVLVGQHPHRPALVFVCAVLLIMLPVLVAVVRTSAWLQYRTAHLWLAGTGRLPWRFLRLLEQARDAGVLRQTGSTHRFRHVRLLHQLHVPATNVTGSRRRAWPPEEWPAAWRWSAGAAVCLLIAGGAVRQADIVAAAEQTQPTLATPTWQDLQRHGACLPGCRVTGHVAVNHKSWGPVTLLSTLDESGDEPIAGVVVTDRTGKVRWQQELDTWTELTIAGRDRTGNVFLIFSMGGDKGVVVLHPVRRGFAELGPSPEDPYFFSSNLIDAGDGSYAIDQSINDCSPPCADGAVTHTRYYWTGKSYRP
ncbi:MULTISPECIES: NACHT domain-containing NTPase [unclassified Actinoplanes]|uniref:NACHT domain-containing protein n=1 Tax=unclassified Actinoplanes TaxID=2626549 RepID=UPI001E4DA0BF|nr:MULTISPECIES: NACHT domain-containing protein [unclassified Actinoplanes]